MVYRILQQISMLVILLTPVLSNADSHIGSTSPTDVDNDHSKKMAAFARDFPWTFTLLGDESDENGRKKRHDEATLRLKQRFSLSVEQKKLAESAANLITDEKTSLIEKAQAHFFLSNYSQSEKLALAEAENKRDPKKNKDPSIVHALKLAAYAALESKKNETALKHLHSAERETSPQRDLTEWARVQWVLSEVLRRMQRYAENEKKLRFIVEEYSRQLGAENEQTLSYRNELVLSLIEQNAFSNAESELIALLKLFEKVTGADSAKTQATRRNLANLYSKFGRYADEEELRKRILDSDIKSFGLDHPALIESRIYLAFNLSNQRKLDDADLIYTDILHNCSRMYGVNHYLTLKTRHYYAMNTMERGRFAEAVTQFQILYQTELKELGEAHNLTVNTGNALCYCLIQINEHSRAELLLRSILSASVRMHPRDDLEVATTRNALGLVLQQQGKTEEAEKEYQIVLEIRERILGPYHTKTLGTKQNIINLSGSRISNQQKIEQFRNLLENSSKTADRLSEQVLSIRYNLANTLAKVGEKETALQEFEKLHKDHLLAYGNDDPRTLMILHVIATESMNLGRLEEANEMFSDVLARREKVLEPENIDILTTKFFLGICLCRRGNFSEGDTLMESAYYKMELSPNIDPSVLADFRKHLTRTKIQSSLKGKSSPSRVNLQNGSQEMLNQLSRDFPLKIQQ